MEKRYMLPDHSNGCGIPSSPAEWGVPELIDCGGMILARYESGVTFKYAVKCQNKVWRLIVEKPSGYEKPCPGVVIHPKGYFKEVDFDGRSPLRYWCVEAHIPK